MHYIRPCVIEDIIDFLIVPKTHRARYRYETKKITKYYYRVCEQDRRRNHLSTPNTTSVLLDDLFVELLHLSAKQCPQLSTDDLFL